MGRQFTFVAIIFVLTATGGCGADSLASGQGPDATPDATGDGGTSKDGGPGDAPAFDAATSQDGSTSGDAATSFEPACISCLEQACTPAATPIVQACLDNPECVEQALCKLACWASGAILTCYLACSEDAPEHQQASEVTYACAGTQCPDCFPQKSAGACSELKQPCDSNVAGYACCSGLVCSELMHRCRKPIGSLCVPEEDSCDANTQCKDGTCQPFVCWDRGLTPDCALPCCTPGDKCETRETPGGQIYECCVPSSMYASTVGACCSKGGEESGTGYVCF